MFAVTNIARETGMRTRPYLDFKVLLPAKRSEHFFVKVKSAITITNVTARSIELLSVSNSCFVCQTEICWSKAQYTTLQH